MRLENFLSEEIITEKDWAILEKECQDFLSFMRRHCPGYVLTRFAKYKGFGVYFTRKDRKPLDTPLGVHEIIDDLLFKHA